MIVFVVAFLFYTGAHFSAPLGQPFQCHDLPIIILFKVSRLEKTGHHDIVNMTAPVPMAPSVASTEASCSPGASSASRSRASEPRSEEPSCRERVCVPV